MKDWYEDGIKSIYGFIIGNHEIAPRLHEKLVVTQQTDSMKAFALMCEMGVHYCLVRDDTQPVTWYSGVLRKGSCEKGKKVGDCAIEPIEIQKNLFHYRCPYIFLIDKRLPYVIVDHRDNPLVHKERDGHVFELVEMTNENLDGMQLRMLAFGLLSFIERCLRNEIDRSIEKSRMSMYEVLEYLPYKERRDELVLIWELYYKGKSGMYISKSFFSTTRLSDVLYIGKAFGIFSIENEKYLDEIYELRNAGSHVDESIERLLERMRYAIHVFFELLMQPEEKVSSEQVPVLVSNAV